jgi:putative IMPACT (imprinted ancient) family translation regulator
MKCEFCSNEFSNKQNLNAHQKRTKYCLKLQKVNIPENEYKCIHCLTEFNIQSNYKRHIKICKISKVSIKYEKQIILIENKVENLKNIIAELRHQISDNKELSITTIKPLEICKKRFIEQKDDVTNISKILKAWKNNW